MQLLKCTKNYVFLQLRNHVILLMLLSLQACNARVDIQKINSSKKVSVVFMQPLGVFNDSLAKRLQDEIQRSLSVKAILMPAIGLPSNAWYAPRHRYWADSILLLLKPLHNIKDNYTLGITEEDISTKKDLQPNWGVMGLGFQPGNCCVVSTYRLYKYPQTQKQLLEKLLKVSLHELGHNFGLPHCINKNCIMTDAKGKDNLTNEIDFCPVCRKMLTAKGLQPMPIGQFQVF
jgi:archaemetzincin